MDDRSCFTTRRWNWKFKDVNDLEKYTLFWFRRDLRIEDNHGLYQALQGKNKVLPIFIFDSVILDRLPKQDARVEFILLALGAIDVAMKRNRCNVGIYHGTPKAIFQKLIEKGTIEKVVCNEDYDNSLFVLLDVS